MHQLPRVGSQRATVHHRVASLRTKSATILHGLARLVAPNTGVPPAPSQTAGPPSTAPPDVLPPPSLEVIYEAVAARLSEQLDQIDALDAQASFLLTASSFITAASVGVQTVFFSGVLSTYAIGLVPTRWIILLETAVALAIFVLLIRSAWPAYVVRKLQSAPEPDELLSAYPMRPPHETRGEITAARAQVYDTNSAIIRDKVSALDKSFILFRAEVAIIALMMITLPLLQSFGAPMSTSSGGHNTSAPTTSSENSKPAEPTPASTPQPASTWPYPVNPRLIATIDTAGTGSTQPVAPDKSKNQ